MKNIKFGYIATHRWCALVSNPGHRIVGTIGSTELWRAPLLVEICCCFLSFILSQFPASTLLPIKTCWCFEYLAASASVCVLHSPKSCISRTQRAWGEAKKSRMASWIIENDDKTHFLGCRHSSADSSAPSILPPRVRVPRKAYMLYQFILFKLYICHLVWNVKKWKINKKTPRLAHFINKNFLLQSVCFKWAIPGFFFFIFVFSIQLTVNKCSKQIFPMTWFEPRTSGVETNCSTNWARITVQTLSILADEMCPQKHKNLWTINMETIFFFSKWTRKTIGISKWQIL